MSGAGYLGPDGATELGYDDDAHQARGGAVYQLMLYAKGSDFASYLPRSYVLMAIISLLVIYFKLTASIYLLTA